MSRIRSSAPCVLPTGYRANDFASGAGPGASEPYCQGLCGLGLRRKILGDVGDRCPVRVMRAASAVVSRAVRTRCPCPTTKSSWSPCCHRERTGERRLAPGTSDVDQAVVHRLAVVQHVHIGGRRLSDAGERPRQSRIRRSPARSSAPHCIHLSGRDAARPGRVAR